MAEAGRTAGAEEEPRDAALLWTTLGLLLVALIAGYWNALSELLACWQDPQYSHGWLVPVFAAALVWMRREPLVEAPAAQRWSGVALLGGSLAARVACAWFGLDVPDMWTFVPCLAGLVLLVGGWAMFRWAGPAVGFLIFMFPLPWSVEKELLLPLQKSATQASTYALQTLGIEACREGQSNVIRLPDERLGVVDRCSGLRMATIFFAFSVAIVLVAHRRWWENLLILLSAVPIAMAVNVARITLTGILYLATNRGLAQSFFHDWAGYFMMPLALGLLWLELIVLSHLFCEEEKTRPLPIWHERDGDSVDSWQ